ncbi:MAG: aspartate kinase [Candidatus Harrisonbacteria bacterium RIFCSPHIGHO2_01_FULL_44_13]|uniref:Uridylate kinase n=1 Tax=Candidatus Harrisonbacteria bacterium RIFCSPLOWO2_01_FULL_44_18 TaxID=1798407 RepID=A0A1G1ZLV7_9BACT|nr:MAG: aspartate kinase [Candidatus Harrisonbacteria bacterium RIFCSPHIGHO2_01_FULL_44_13]OGY65572.1 MAG: aspartate kinase [Candidatus Harrisonbacteria bacterium RIFCSPLOWO2_01_FULL_44_18]
MRSEKIVISVGGSLVVPDGGIDTKFLSGLNNFIRKKLAENPNRQFFIVVGGGHIARHYRDAGKAVLGRELAEDDLDWLGIHATRLNAHLVRTIFRDLASPNIIKDYDNIRKAEEPVVIAAGWKPGWSTDYDAVMLCEHFGAGTVINLSNIDRVYNKDPRKYLGAKPISKISWKEFRRLTGNKWISGMNTPFDPIAAKKAEELGVKVIIMKGGNWGNLEKYFEGKKFIGTIVE